MIHLKGVNGSDVHLVPEKITAWGIDPPSERRLWVRCDGQEYGITLDVDEQKRQLEALTPQVFRVGSPDFAPGKTIMRNPPEPYVPGSIREAF